MKLKDIAPSLLTDEKMRVKVDGEITIGYTESFIEEYSDREIEYIGAVDIWEEDDDFEFSLPVVDVWLKEEEHET